MEAAVKDRLETENTSVLPDVEINIEKLDAHKKKKPYLFIKRAIDIAGSALGLIVLFIPMAIIAVLIRLDSPGPAIYSQKRLGKDGREFTMYKFRSMYMDAEKNGPQFAAEKDKRCTRVGSVIRLFHIDELPQLWNVIIGDMSLVGPRPERDYFYDEIEKSVPGFRDRLKVKPGLTGLSQVKGSYIIPAAEKLAYDREYIDNMSFWTDLKIMLETVIVVLKHKGAR